MKAWITNHKVQFWTLVVLTVLYMGYGYSKTIHMMTKSNPYMHTVTIITLVLGTILVIVVGYLALVKKCKIEQIYPVIGLTLGIIYILVIPTFAAPDEGYHFSAAYNLSNKIMGVEETGIPKKVYMRECDTEYRETTFRADLYNKYGKTFEGNADTELVISGDMARGDHSVGGYLLPALGISFGRLLGLNFPMMAMLGTFFGVAWFVLWMTYALKKLPFGKRALLTILLFPLTLQEVSSFSRDSALLACGILAVSLALHWKYDKDGIKKSEVLVFAYATFVLATVKSALYAHLILFAFFILINRKWFQGKRRYYWMAGLLLIISMAFVIMVPMHGWDIVVNLMTTENELFGSGVYSGTPLYYITHPFVLIRMLGNTLKKYGLIYVLEITGNGLGWLEIPNTVKPRTIYIILAIVSVIRIKGEEQKIDAQTRIWCNVFGWGGILLCFAAMLVFWTPVGHDVIEGVQGRYFLPLLFPIFIGMGHWKQPQLPINMNKYYPIALTGMGYIMALGVIRFNVM